MSRFLPVRIVAHQHQPSHPQARARMAREHRGLAQMAMWQAREVPFPMKVYLTRLGPRKLDDDNLQGAFKHLRDGVADRLGIQDNDPRVTWVYRQEKSKQFGVRITLEGVQ